MILIGWLVYALVYLAFGLATQSWHAWALFCGYAVFCAGLTEPAEKTLTVAGPGRHRAARDSHSARTDPAISGGRFQRAVWLVV